jgi:hypothetical protein
MSNLTPHQRWMLQKRKCSVKRLKYEYKRNVAPYVYVCIRWTIKHSKVLPKYLGVSVLLMYILVYLFSSPKIELSVNPTLKDLRNTGSVVAFEGGNLNGEQRVLSPGIYCMCQFI